MPFARPFALLLAAALAACDNGGTPGPPCTGAGCESPPRAVEVVGTRDLGVVGKPATTATRDGGESVLVGGKVLWTFGDTFFSPRSVDGVNFRTNTAALADPATPLAVSEPLDANGAPFAALAFTPEETAYNDTRDPTQDRIALWFGGLVPEGAGALAFYLKLVARPNLAYTYLGVGTARFAAGQTRGTRTPGLLFDYAKGEPRFERPLLHDGTVYLYGELPGRTGVFGLARAPLARATERAAYTFWSGSAWTGDVSKTAVVFDGVPGQMSAAWNPHLGRFMAVYMNVPAQKVVYRTAARPEGPWSAPADLFTPMRAETGFAYAAQEHPHLRTNGGRGLFVTYYRPKAGFLQGELRAVEVTLK